MKLDEAFHLGIIPALAGFRWNGEELLDRLRAGAQGPLLAKLDEQSRRLNDRNPETVKLVLLAERLLAKLELAPAPRPQTPDGYRAWAKQVADAGMNATAANAHETAAYFLGRALGNLLMTLALRVLTDDLLGAAPEHPFLVAQRDALAAGEAQALRLFETAAQNPAHGDAVRKVLDEDRAILATLATAAPREAVFRHLNASIPGLEAALRE